MTPNKVIANNFAEYLQSVVKLNTLERITTDLDNELADSQKVMDNIKNMLNSIPTFDSGAQMGSGDLSNEDVLSFLEAGPPQVLLPDMVGTTTDVDLDNVIATMKKHAEDLKKKIVLVETPLTLNNEIKNLELEQYASSLDQLGKRLANIKLNKRDEVNLRNEELEAKLTLLCDNVNLFTQMVKTKTSLSESNKNWTPTQDNNALCYENIVNKLLSGINEVTYLLHNQN